MSGFFCHVSNISATVSAKITDVNVIDTVTCPWSSLRTKCHVNLFLYNNNNNNNWHLSESANVNRLIKQWWIDTTSTLHFNYMTEIMQLYNINSSLHIVNCYLLNN